MTRDRTHHTAADAGAERLVPLGSRPGVRLAADEPDIRGWDLLDQDGHPLAVVEELLIDSAADEVAALAVQARDGLVVVPIDVAHIDVGRRAVMTNLTPAQFGKLPRGGASSRSAAADARTDTRPAADLPADSSRPRGQRVTDRTASGTAGDAASEHHGVTVHRTADGEEIVRVPIVEEELVVERRPVVKEIMLIRKRAVHDEHVIEADLRRERIDVDRRDIDHRDGGRR